MPSVAVFEAATRVKINVYHKNVLKNQKKESVHTKKRLHKSQSIRWFMNGFTAY